MLSTKFSGYKIAKQLYEENEAAKEMLEIMNIITYQQVKVKVFYFCFLALQLIL